MTCDLGLLANDCKFDFDHDTDMEHEIDGWIEQLSQCKQLAEADVKKLCDKVRSLFFSATPLRSTLTDIQRRGRS